MERINYYLAFTLGFMTGVLEITLYRFINKYYV